MAQYLEIFKSLKGKPDKNPRNFHLQNYQFQRNQDHMYMNTMVTIKNGEKMVEHQEWSEKTPLLTDKFQRIRAGEAMLLVSLCVLTRF